MMGISLVNILYSKVVHYEAESDGPPLVAPEARRGKFVIVPQSVEACSKEVVGELSILK